MTRRMVFACGLALVLAAPGTAGAGEVRLAIKDGRVALVARDATLREILLEWERVGGTRIVNRDRVPGTRLNLELANVTEAEALTTLLRPIAGYMASRRLGPEGGSSVFSRIVLMPAGSLAGHLHGLAVEPGGRSLRPGRPALRTAGHAAAGAARRPGGDGDGRPAADGRARTTPTRRGLPGTLPA